MAVTAWLRRLAARAPVPTFVVAGRTGSDVEALRLDPRLRIVDSPRHATVLLVAGMLPEALRRPAAQVHDGLPHPRATVWWGDGQPDVAWLLDCPRVASADDVAAPLTAVHAQLMLGRRTSDQAVVTSTGRTAWRGVGPYGHGGSGMTGGAPYGRPLADRADDLRDGLTLDVLPLTVGPFFPAFPAGLSLRVRLLGDVVAAAEVLPDPFLDIGASAVSHAAEEAFDRARTGEVLVADVEMARVAHLLRALARELRLHGVAALGVRSLQLAVLPRPPADGVRRLLDAIERCGLRRVGPGVGRLSQDAVGGRGLGLLARASGAAEDARSDDPAYAALGFAPIVQHGGDARARLMQRIAEVRQSLGLAERAAQRVRDSRWPVEDPRVPVAAVAELVPDLLVGLEWGDAVAALASLDLAVGASALARPEASSR